MTTVNQGTLLLDDSTGQSLAGNLTIGTGTGASGSAVARWLFANQQSAAAVDTVLSDGLLDLNGKSQTLLALNVAGGQVTTGASGNGQLTVGGLNMTGGTVTAVTAGGSVLLAGNVNAGATAAGVPAVINGPGTLSLNGATRNFNVNGPAFTAPALADLAINAVITGSGSAGINKQGSGTMQLTAAEIYTGTTTVTQGTLYADGTVGPVSLAGGTIGGNGTVGPVTSTAQGGAITGGDGPPVPPNALNVQTTTLAPVATLNSATKFNVELYGPGDGTDSQVTVTGPSPTTPAVVMNINNAVLTGILDPAINIGQSFVILTTNNANWTIAGKFTEQAGNPGVVFINGEKFTIAYLDVNGNPTTTAVTQVVLTRTLNTATVAVSSSVNPSVYGQGVTFTATVTPELGTGTLPPTDTVTFEVDNNPLTDKSVPVDKFNKATFNPVALFGPLSIGGHTITATFNADGNDISFASTDFGTFNQTVGQANSGITVSSSPSNPIPGQTVTVTATLAAVPPGSGQPTGQVQFFLDTPVTGTPVATVTLSNGVASTPLPFLSASLHRIRVKYLGDTNFQQATTPTDYLITVVKGIDDVQIAGTSTPSPTVYGQTLTLTATLTGPVTPTGTVTFYNGGITQADILGSGTLSGGVTSITVPEASPRAAPRPR